ncbi:hypothetical protein LguiA_032497 [Lonicera macranthoides]
MKMVVILLFFFFQMRPQCANLTFNLAIPISDSPQFSPLMVVKSCSASHSVLFMNEKFILDELKDFPLIIICFGDSFSFEKVLQCIYQNGFVHCYIKFQIFPLFENGDDYTAKIDNFSLAKKAGVVAEMVTGDLAWRCRKKIDIYGLLIRIGMGQDVPEIPGKLSEEREIFPRKVFSKGPKKKIDR